MTTIPRIPATVAAASAVFDVPAALILSQSRESRVVMARHAVAWALRSEGYTFVAVGDMLDRDHTSIMFAVKAAELRAIGNARYALQLSALLRR